MCKSLHDSCYLAYWLNKRAIADVATLLFCCIDLLLRKRFANLATCKTPQTALQFVKIFELLYNHNKQASFSEVTKDIIKEIQNMEV